MTEIKENSYNDPEKDAKDIIKTLKANNAHVTENERTLLQAELCNASNDNTYYSNVIYNFKESQRLESKLRETGIWEKPPTEIINMITKIENLLVGFKIQEVYEGLSNFVVILVPQVHRIDYEKDDGKIIHNYYVSEATSSQENIFKTLKILREYDISAVNAWEGFFVDISSHPEYMSWSSLDENIDDMRSSKNKLRKAQLKDPAIEKSFLNYFIESASLSTKKEGSLARRNRAISANLFNLAQNTGANAINLILGEYHFDRNMKDMEAMQDILEDFGISYVLLSSTQPNSVY